MSASPYIAVIGGGPAGLRAAEVAASSGARVTLYDGKRSVGRKFLVAGKGGLNLTHGEEFEKFISRYEGPTQPENLWRDLISAFSPQDLRQWAAGLGCETFQARTGRVYPKALKAAPLLRAWVSRLKHLGVVFEMDHRLSGIAPGNPHRIAFENGRTIEAEAVIFALGGASWPQTGSDGNWIRLFESAGIPCHGLEPANCGWEHAWPSSVLAAAEGSPIKNVVVRAGERLVSGELLITRYGLEGGAIYQLGSALRSMAEPVIEVDFKPTFTVEQLIRKMESVRSNLVEEAVTRWKLGEAAAAMLAESACRTIPEMAAWVKRCVIPLERPRPIEEAISSAGGVCWEELDESLMIRRFPGLFVAGEMIDWEAPTGGYLMQGCFATGTRAGHAAARFIGCEGSDSARVEEPDA